MEYQQDELKSVQVKVIPLRDCQYILLPDASHIYGMAFDDEPVVMVLMAA